MLECGPGSLMESPGRFLSVGAPGTENRFVHIGF
jgi:hypothetical protein